MSLSTGSWHPLPNVFGEGQVAMDSAWLPGRCAIQIVVSQDQLAQAYTSGTVETEQPGSFLCEAPAVTAGTLQPGCCCPILQPGQCSVCDACSRCTVPWCRLVPTQWRGRVGLHYRMSIHHRCCTGWDVRWGSSSPAGVARCQGSPCAANSQLWPSRRVRQLHSSCIKR